MLTKLMSRVMMLTLLAGVLVAFTGCEERMVEEIAAGRQPAAWAVDYFIPRPPHADDCCN